MPTMDEPGPVEPSHYERLAWTSLVEGHARPTRRAAQAATDAANHAYRVVRDSTAGQKVARAGSAVSRHLADTVPQRVKDASRKAADSAAVDWIADAARGAGRTVARVSRVGLSPSRVVRAHQKKGHAVSALHEVRSLDLELVDRVRGRNVDLLYASLGAATGAGAGLLITGGEVGVGTGVASAPGGTVVAITMAGDIAALIGLASRAVGQVALAYGHDPEDPLEKAFVLSVVNFGTAGSTAAKEAAFVDVVRLSQLLVRGASWRALEESLFVKAARTIAEKLSMRFTKRSLGKLIPVLGVGVGAVMNFATLESVVDSANIAYRRRFLLDKYPLLVKDGDIDAVSGFEQTVDDSDDVIITIADYLDEATDGGAKTRPDIRNASKSTSVDFVTPANLSMDLGADQAGWRLLHTASEPMKLDATHCPSSWTLPRLDRPRFGGHLS